MSILFFLSLIFIISYLFRLINLNPTNNGIQKPIKPRTFSTKEDFPENEELHKQNELLLNQFENDVEKVKEAQKRLYEISQLISTFSNKVVEQDLTTEASKNFQAINFI